MCMHVCAFVNFFFTKTSPQKLLTGLLPNFIAVFHRSRLKSSLTEKSGLWSNTGAQAPLVILIGFKTLWEKSSVSESLKVKIVW